MARVLPVVASGETTGWMIFCPACDEGHEFNTKPGVPNGVGGFKPTWRFANNDVERPTLRESMLVRTGCKAPGHKPGDYCWCTYAKTYGKPAPYTCRVCHSFVTDGKIRFLGDCTHALKGQTVDLPDWNDLDRPQATGV